MNNISNLSVASHEQTYDISSCEREPIHRLGRVQGHGALLAFSSDWLVVAHSDNLNKFYDKVNAEFIGSSAASIFTQETVSAITQAVKRLNHPDQVERLLNTPLFSPGTAYDISLHLSGELLIIEFEPVSDNTEHSAMDQLRQALRGFSTSDDYLSLCDSAARSVAEMIGFDRVMIYKFHPDESGEVIAEHRMADVDSFMGLRYPASDIPSQARALYKRNLTRLAADLEDEASLIVPAETDIDLSLSTLRSVSPIHIEYLINMGIKASYSISIIIKGKLWGLIACHHHSPKRVNLTTRTYTELFAESFALELSSRLDKHNMVDDSITRRLHTQMMAGLDTSLPLIENLRGYGDRLKNLLPCASLVVLVDDEYSVFGDPVGKEDIQILKRLINRGSTTSVTAVDSIDNWVKDKDLTIADRFAGLIAVPISRRPRDMLIYLRREERQDVVWAGNPEKPVEYGPNGSRLSPRKSFAAWSELRRGYCSPWTESEMAMANQIRGILLEIIVRNIDEHSRLVEESQQQQDMLIHELNHRVRNILGLINSIVGQTATSVESVVEFKTILAGRIQALALAQNKLTEQNWTYAPWNSILEMEFDAFVNDRSRVRISGPDFLLSPKAFTAMTLVTHELVTNATKYGALSTLKGHIDVSWVLNGHGDIELEWKESGVTIDEQPTRTGFGSLIIDRAVPFDLNGSSKVQFARHGLIANFVIPGEHIQTDATRTTEKETAPVVQSDAALNDQEPVSATDRSKATDQGKALVVEDNMMIALEEESALQSIGFSRVELRTSVDGALSAIAAHDFSFAILDVNLGRETSEPIAEALMRQQIPFVFASGYDEWQERLSERFNVQVLSKPFTRESLLSTVQKVLAERAG